MFVPGGFTFVQGGSWHSNLTKFSLIYSVSNFNLRGAWSFVCGAKPTKAPVATRLLLGLLPPRLSPEEKLAGKGVNEWVCRPTMNLSIYEIVFGLLARCECRIQIIKHIGRTLAFLWKCLKSIRHRRKSGIDTLKLHHDTLSKTLKKHCLNDTKFKLPCRVLPRPCKLVLQPSYQAHGVREDLQGTHPEHKNKPGEMKAEFVHTQSSRCKTIAVIKRRQQTTISIKKIDEGFWCLF